jgi:hypothetical protein
VPPLVMLLAAFAPQAPPPPPAPPRPPAFMSMKGLPLACFDKPTFEEDGMEFFVCNGVRGLSGVRRKSDSAGAIIVRDPDIALNLNMQAATLACKKTGAKSFAVGYDSSGISFKCDEKEMDRTNRFRAGSKAEWKKFDAYLEK